MEQEGGGEDEEKMTVGGVEGILLSLQATAKILCPHELPLLLSPWTTCQCSTPRFLTNDINLS